MKPEEEDLDSWEPQEPSAGFAERVVTAARHEGKAPKRPTNARRALAGAVMFTTVAAGFALVVHAQHASAKGDVVADTRREVHVGTRAIAVLEPGAHLKCPRTTV